MKFSCEKALLQSGVNIASRAVSSKSPVPTLEGVLIEASSHLQLTGYNLETGIRTNLPAQVEVAGNIVLNARLFGEIIRRLPDEIVTVSVIDNTVTITCGMSEFAILGTPADEFPELPAIEHQNAFHIPQKKLKSMIGETLFAVSASESRPVHTGSLFEIENDSLTVVSMDGYRLALRRESIEQAEGQEGGFSFVVPGNALSEVEKIASDSENMVTIIQGNRHILFQLEETILISRRLEGEFLSYKQVIPQNSPISVEGDTHQLINSIERVSLIISERLKSPIRCVFDHQVLKLSTTTTLGRAYDECPLKGDGKGLEIGFNNRYLLDALKAAPTDAVRLEMSTSISPCVILPAEGEASFVYLVLPVRLKAGE